MNIDACPRRCGFFLFNPHPPADLRLLMIVKLLYEFINTPFQLSIAQHNFSRALQQKLRGSDERGDG